MLYGLRQYITTSNPNPVDVLVFHGSQKSAEDVLHLLDTKEQPGQYEQVENGDFHVTIDVGTKELVAKPGDYIVDLFGTFYPMDAVVFNAIFSVHVQSVRGTVHLGDRLPNIQNLPRETEISKKIKDALKPTLGES